MADDLFRINDAPSVRPAGNPEQGRAWVALTIAFAAHVMDEALTGFLAVYNPAVIRIREFLPWLPLPTFTFPVWLTGLIFAVLLAFGLSRYVFRGAVWTRRLSVGYGILMLVNGISHLAGSVFLKRVMPGAYSAPLLIVASLWLLSSVFRRPRQNPDREGGVGGRIADHHS